jgi:hypothetical protein
MGSDSKLSVSQRLCQPWITNLTSQTLVTCFVYAEAEGEEARVVVTTPTLGYGRSRLVR